MLTASQIFRRLVREITPYDFREKQSITFLLLEHFWKLEKKDVLADRPVPNFSEEVYTHVLRRINLCEPVQHIMGSVQFYGGTFLVDRNVLIPRPETEQLVDLIARECTGEHNLSIVDIGTGSGCIAISLQKVLSSATVYGIDVSDAALEMAWRNARLNEAQVTFLHADIKCLDQFSSHVDLIVSNPPYVLDSEKKEMTANVLAFEPSLALFVSDSDPLCFYRHILLFSKKFLKSSGKVYFEINSTQAGEIQILLEDFGFNHIRILQDLNDKDRFVIAQKGLGS